MGWRSFSLGEMAAKRFASAQAALAYLVNCNPARMKGGNVIESDGQRSHKGEQFSGDHPADVWASICAAVTKTLRSIDDQRVQYAVEQYYLRERAEALSKAEIAARIGTSLRRVNQLLTQFLEEIEHRLEYRELLKEVEQKHEFDA